MAKPIGTALYLEFRSADKKSTQYIIAPQGISPITGNVVKARLLFRQVDKDHPQKGWRTRMASDEYELDGIGGIKNVANLDTALAQGAELMAFAAGYINQMGLADWTLYKMPLAIQLSGDDLAFFEKAETPKALIRRINAARTTAGFPKDYYEV